MLIKIEIIIAMLNKANKVNLMIWFIEDLIN